MSTMSVSQIEPTELQKQMAERPQLLLVDVRTPAEFREVHVTGAINIPLDELTPDRVAAAARSGSPEPFFFICKKGGRSRQACEKMLRSGVTGVVSIEGGTEACVAAGLPVERGKRTISLERQVRIIAGSLAAAGAILAMTVNPYFAAIPAVVGLGLVHAGATDSCMMGMCLAKMPWNR